MNILLLIINAILFIIPTETFLIKKIKFVIHLVFLIVAVIFTPFSLPERIAFWSFFGVASFNLIKTYERDRKAENQRLHHLYLNLESGSISSFAKSDIVACLSLYKQGKLGLSVTSYPYGQDLWDLGYIKGHDKLTEEGEKLLYKLSRSYYPSPTKE